MKPRAKERQKAAGGDKKSKKAKSGKKLVPELFPEPVHEKPAKNRDGESREEAAKHASHRTPRPQRLPMLEPRV